MVVPLMTLLVVTVARAESTPQAASRLATLIAGDDSVRIVQAEPTGALLEVDGPSGGPAGTLTLTTDPPPGTPPRIITPSFYLFMNVLQFDSGSVERLDHVVHRIVERDDGSLGFVRKPLGGNEPLNTDLLVGVAIAVVLAGVTLLFRRRVVFQLRAPHLIPAAIQTLLLAYWWLYWPAVGRRVPSILLQIVLAYAVDAFISLLKERTWRIGFGPLPIVLSSNLFAWFSPRGAVVVVVAAVASRAFIRRGGRHILNPSAAGLTVAGLLSMASQDFNFGGVFHTLDVPPNMAELILLLSLVPQIRFRIVLVSVGAAIALSLCGKASVLGLPGLLLAFALFATDPATMPRTPIAQLLFGAFVGSATLAFSMLLVAVGQPDDLSKVFPVPIANGLVGWLDALGEKFAPAHLLVLAPRWNLAHVALWLYLVVPEISATKSAQFLIAPHWDYATPLVNYRSTDVPRCEDNPIFCRPFTFPQEISQWAARGLAY